jgi:hypothetical protein
MRVSTPRARWRPASRHKRDRPPSRPSLAGRREPGALLTRECRHARSAGVRPIGSPANSESRSRLTAPSRPSYARIPGLSLSSTARSRRRRSLCEALARWRRNGQTLGFAQEESSRAPRADERFARKAVARRRPGRTSAMATPRSCRSPAADERLATRAIVCVRTRFAVRTRLSAQMPTDPLCAEVAQRLAQAACPGRS